MQVPTFFPSILPKKCFQICFYSYTIYSKFSITSQASTHHPICLLPRKNSGGFTALAIGLGTPDD